MMKRRRGQNTRTLLWISILVMCWGRLGICQGAEPEAVQAAKPADAARESAFLPGELQPANPNLIPEARTVLAYLKSIEGKKTLTVMPGAGHVGAAFFTEENHQALLAFLDRHLKH